MNFGPVLQRIMLNRQIPPCPPFFKVGERQGAVKVVMPFMLAAVLCACSSVPEATPGRLGLKLAPASLGATISLQQHLRVEREGRSDDLDAALEVDPAHVELVGLALGQRVLSLNYDGKEIKSWRHLLLPRQVQAEDVLQDLQLTLWPVEAIRAALPAGWRITENGLQRQLFQDEALVLQIDYSDPVRWSGTVTLQNLRYHYRLAIQSVASEAAEVPQAPQGVDAKEAKEAKESNKATNPAHPAQAGKEK